MATDQTLSHGLVPGKRGFGALSDPQTFSALFSWWADSPALGPHYTGISNYLVLPVGWQGLRGQGFGPSVLSTA